MFFHRLLHILNLNTKELSLYYPKVHSEFLSGDRQKTNGEAAS